MVARHRRLSDVALAACARYDEPLASRKTRGVPDEAELFLHFGHWDAPEQARPGDPTDFASAQERLNERLLQLAELGDAMAVLDLGCGFGGTLATINARWTRMSLVGVNVDARQLDVAKRGIVARATNDLTWCEADACELPLPSKAFDRVLAVESAPHFASRAAFLREAARVLAACGRLVVSDFVASDELKKHRASALSSEIEALVVSGLGPWPDFWGDEGTYEAMADAAGLAVVGRVDATAATLPSYECILGPSSDPASPGSSTAAARGMRLLQSLQRQRLLLMEYLVLEPTRHR